MSKGPHLIPKRLGRGVRLTDDGPEMRCWRCLEWLPIEEDFWTRSNTCMCRACQYERQQEVREGRVRKPAQVARERAYQERYRRFAGRLKAQYAAMWKAENIERAREANRAYYQRNRPEILAKAKARYAARKAAEKAA